MADDNDDIEEIDDLPSDKSSGGGQKVIMIIAGIVLVFLLLVGGIIAFLLSGGEEEQAPQNVINQVNQTGGGDSIKHSAVNRVTSYSTIGPIHELDLFVVNLLSKRGKRYLRIKISLELETDNVIGEIEDKKTVLRDIIIDTLTSRSKEELSTSKGKSRLKDELVVRINAALIDGSIKNVFFTQFIIQ